MSNNSVFISTGKAEREGTKLSAELKRILSLLDGKTRSAELAKRAPPSLRNKWNERINELVEGGYIIDSRKTNIHPKATLGEFDSKNGPVANNKPVAPVRDPDYHRRSSAAQVVALLEGAAAAKEVTTNITAKADASQRAEAVRAAELKTASVAVKTKSDAETKSEAEAKQKAEKAARAAELKAFFAAAKVKAEAEAKQARQDVKGVRAEQEVAAAAAKVKSEAEARAKVEVKQKEHETELAVAELEAAILAAMANLDGQAKPRQETAAGLPIAEISRIHPPSDQHAYKLHAKFDGLYASEAQRLHDLEIENERLKRMLGEAYLRIETLRMA